MLYYVHVSCTQQHHRSFQFPCNSFLGVSFFSAAYVLLWKFLFSPHFIRHFFFKSMRHHAILSGFTPKPNSITSHSNPVRFYGFTLWKINGFLVVVYVVDFRSSRVISNFILLSWSLFSLCERTKKKRKKNYSENREFLQNDLWKFKSIDVGGIFFCHRNGLFFDSCERSFE